MTARDAREIERQDLLKKQISRIIEKALDEMPGVAGITSELRYSFLTRLSFGLLEGLDSKLIARIDIKGGDYIIQCHEDLKAALRAFAKSETEEKTLCARLVKELVSGVQNNYEFELREEERNTPELFFGEGKTYNSKVSFPATV